MPNNETNQGKGRKKVKKIAMSRNLFNNLRDVLLLFGAFLTLSENLCEEFLKAQCYEPIQNHIH